MNTIDTDKYEALKTGSGFIQIQEPGFIQLSGPDRISFLQRQSTNDVQLTSEGHSIPTVLTSPTARILDVLTAFNEPGSQQDPALCVLTLPTRGNKSFQHLKSRIFFMDEVEIHDLNQSYAQFDLFGPKTESLLRKAGVLAGTEASQPQCRSYTIDEDTTFWLIPPQGTFGLGWRLIAQSEHSSMIHSWLISCGIIPAEPHEVEVLRIESGIPGEAAELTEDYTPLEVRLGSLVSGTKGCYTGQEIIARQITYDKVTRQLTGLKLDKEASPGSTVFVDGKNTGRITSSTLSPIHGPIGLAVLKRPFFEPGTLVSIQSGSHTTAGTTINIPF